MDSRLQIYFFMLTSQQIVSSDALLNALKAAANNKQTAAPAKRKDYTFKPMCIAVDHEIECKQYLSDARGELLPLLQLYKLLVIDLATRGGKTTFFVNEYAPTLTGTPYIMILLLPLRMPTDQVSITSVLPYNSGNFESQIMTYQMFETFAKKYVDKLHFVHLVIDEVHELVKAAVYREQIMAIIGSVFQRVHKVIGLSGTPLTPFEYLGFKHIHVKQLERPTVKSQIITVPKYDLQQFLFNYLKTHQAEPLLVFVYRVSDASFYETLFRQSGFNTAHVTGDNKHESTVMRELLETDNLPEDVKLFSTSVLENGITVRNARVLYINNGGCDVPRIVQSLSRNTTDGVRYLDLVQVTAVAQNETTPMLDFDFDVLTDAKTIGMKNIESVTTARLQKKQQNKENEINYKLVKQCGILADGVFYNPILDIFDFSELPILGEQYAQIVKNNDVNFIADYLQKTTNFAGVVTSEHHLQKCEQLEANSNAIKIQIKEQSQSDKENAVQWLQNEKDKAVFLGIIKQRTAMQSLKFSLYQYKEPQTIAPEFNERISRNFGIFENVAYQYTRLKKVLFGAMQNDKLCQIAGLEKGDFTHELKRIGVQVYEALYGVYGDGVPYEISDNLAIIKAEKYNELNRVKLHILAALSSEKDTAIQGGKQVQGEPLNGGYILPKTAAKILCELDSDFEGKADTISNKAALAYLRVLFDVETHKYGKDKVKLYFVQQIAKDAYFDSSLFLQQFDAQRL